jgi:hypothetical protein
MHQGRRLQRLPWLLNGPACSAQLPQFFVHQREELPGSLRIALLYLRQDAGYIRHADENNERRVKTPGSAN